MFGQLLLPEYLSAYPFGFFVRILAPMESSLFHSNHFPNNYFIHSCFVPIHSSLFWAFTLPACILWLLMLIRNQLSITACKQSRPMVDREQLYWAKSLGGNQNKPPI
jgi:hypothetical protein